MPNTESYYFTEAQFETMCAHAERYAMSQDSEADDLFYELAGDDYADAVLSTIA